MGKGGPAEKRSFSAVSKIGPFQATIKKLLNVTCWLPRQLAGTPALEREIAQLQSHVSAMTEILYILVADRIESWSLEIRERILRQIANFTLIDNSLKNLKLSQNPFTQAEIQRLQMYSQRAQSGGSFSPEEAWEFRRLSERAVQEYAGQDWVTELLKVALFIFALYVLAQLFRRVEENL